MPRISSIRKRQKSNIYPPDQDVNQQLQVEDDDWVGIQCPKWEPNSNASNQVKYCQIINVKDTAFEFWLKHLLQDSLCV